MFSLYASLSIDDLDVSWRSPVCPVQVWPFFTCSTSKNRWDSDLRLDIRSATFQNLMSSVMPRLFKQAMAVRSHDPSGLWKIKKSWSNINLLNDASSACCRLMEWEGLALCSKSLLHPQTSPLMKHFHLFSKIQSFLKLHGVTDFSSFLIICQNPPSAPAVLLPPLFYKLPAALV